MSVKEEEYDELDDDDDVLEDNFDPNQFFVEDELEIPTATSYSTDTLHTMIHQGDIDLDPGYQREVVWPAAKQSQIIQSLFHHYYIPPVVFSIYEDPDTGIVIRKCVDGKQRLTSVQKFMDGQIPYKHPRTKKLWFYSVTKSQRGSKKEIPDEWKEIFDNKLITAVEFHHLTTDGERELFQRVQLGMPLTVPERLQAIPSEWSEWVLRLDRTYVTIENGLVDYIDIATTRARTFYNVAILVFCCHALPATRSQPTASTLEKFLRDTPSPEPEFKRKIDHALQMFLQIASDVKYGQIAFKSPNKKVAPVEFVFIGVLLYLTDGDDYDDDTRARYIARFRRTLRDRHKDIRMNNRVVATAWEILEAIQDEDDELPSVGTKRKSRAQDGPSGKGKGRGRGRGRGRGTGRA
ncbi:uncharacterized protein STEHIDRAFT_102019 [Stereum hirsutum FP-91666 SS1]|uniref:uncharacterized protein n=1 Tax=Stereum hirsutum (strain FP-91666) TaxID=721885 RepID=UPI000444A11D|nr:uncharacterized protein STEHIDRAFT_102019 [Stereum hirsutum FP-91666 SS1]EIM82659.1 hypothetical protein STEHIDRAFT_102019 [Stereum hirsutum FP-91666 SS1]